MTDTDHLITETAERLFGDLCSKETIEAAESGEWPDDLWTALEAAGFTAALTVSQPDEIPDMDIAAAILRSAGRFAAPVPVAETMLASWVLSASRLEIPPGPLALAPVRRIDDVRLLIAQGGTARLHGTAWNVPWAGRAARIVLLARGDDGWSVARVDPARCAVRSGRNHAGEPRDAVAFDGVSLAMDEVARLGPALSPERIRCLGALLRTVMMAGALERALDLSLQYVGERVQFGRPLAKFQVIQQNLAVLAGEVAAADMATKGAVAAVARDDLELAVAAAKIRTGEAAGKAASIAHQVHGAIGFTHEHSLHHVTRRLWSWRDEFGSESEWAIVLGTRIADRGADELWPLITKL